MPSREGPSRAVKAYWGWVAFSLAGSLASRLSGLDPGWIAPIASFCTLATGVYAAFAPWVRLDGKPALRALAAVLILGAASEIIGLATGFPFGPYRYTEKWWPTVPLGSLGPYPLLLPWAWLLMAGGAYFALARRLRGAWPIYREWVVPGLLAAGIDLLMEPVMVYALGYWKWLGQPTVPMKFGSRLWDHHGFLPGGAAPENPLGWIVVASIAAYILAKSASDKALEDRSPAYVLLGHCALTLGIGLILLLPGKAA